MDRLDNNLHVNEDNNLDLKPKNVDNNSIPICKNVHFVVTIKSFATK